MKEKNLMVVVTGGVSGMGRKVVDMLVAQRHNVIFSARDAALGEDVARTLNGGSHVPRAHSIPCDLSSFASIREFANEISRRTSSIDILINNAGVMEHEAKESVDGIELDAAVNYFAPFLLTHLLLSLFRRGPSARIVNVTSTMHREGHLDLASFGDISSFNRYRSYADSKLALMFFTRSLAEKISVDQINAIAVHPGVIGTDMTMKNVARMNPIARIVFSHTIRSSKYGAQNIVDAALSPAYNGRSGIYIEEKRVTEPSQFVLDSRLATDLYSKSARVVGIAA